MGSALAVISLLTALREETLLGAVVDLAIGLAYLWLGAGIGIRLGMTPGDLLKGISSVFRRP